MLPLEAAEEEEEEVVLVQREGDAVISPVHRDRCLGRCCEGLNDCLIRGELWMDG